MKIANCGNCFVFKHNISGKGLGVGLCRKHRKDVNSGNEACQSILDFQEKIENLDDKSREDLADLLSGFRGSRDLKALGSMLNG